MNKWLIQVVSRDDRVVAKEIETLNMLQYNWQDFGVIELLTLVTNVENILQDVNDTYIVRGGTKSLQILDNITSLTQISEHCSKEQIELSEIYLKKLREGIFYEVENFDQKVYGQLNLPLINNDVQYYPLSLDKNLELSFDQLKFVKPSRDLKAFNAGLLEPGQKVIEFIQGQQYQPMYIQEELLVSTPKNIWDEYRFFVLGDQVITGSQYRANKQLKPIELGTSAEHVKVMQIAKEYAKLYKPAEVFTMDIGKHGDNEYGIVEYNCFNASGLYKSDVKKLFMTLEDYMNTAKPRKMNKIK